MFNLTSMAIVSLMLVCGGSVGLARTVGTGPASGWLCNGAGGTGLSNETTGYRTWLSGRLWRNHDYLGAVAGDPLTIPTI